MKSATSQSYGDSEDRYTSGQRLISDLADAQKHVHISSFVSYLVTHQGTYTVPFDLVNSQSPVK